MAERSIIDTMAQKLHEDRRARDGFFIPWDECHPSHHKATREDVMPVLRSLIDAGPTEAMVAAGKSSGSRVPFSYARCFQDMLRAALDEADNAL